MGGFVDRLGRLEADTPLHIDPFAPEVRLPYRTLLATLSVALFQACATSSKPPPAPLQPSSSTVVITDSATGGGRDGAAFFFIAEVNDKKVERNNLYSSLDASYGRGPNLVVRPFERELPVGKTKLKLAARYAYSAPIQSLFKAAADWSAEGALEVDLQPGTRYRVNGILDAFRREVWLEEAASNQVVGQKFVMPASKSRGAAAAAGSLYTCCNLHYEGDWISDANWTALPFVPAGTAVSVVDYGRHRANVLIGGRPMRIGHDYGREQESKERFVAKLTVKEDPRERIAGFAPEVQAAIAAGKVLKGMTKEQVIVALGHPRTDVTKSIDAPEWTYWVDDSSEFVVVWGPDQLVKEVDASRSVRRLVVHGEP